MGTNSPFTFNDVVQAADEYSTRNEENDKACVMEFKYNLETKEFVITISAKPLLEEQSKAKQLQIDATFKVNKGDYPCVITGYSDIDLHLHRTTCAIVSNENTQCYKWILEFLKNNEYVTNYEPREIMADAHQAIFAAVQDVFPRCFRRLCYFHVEKAMPARP
uniref:MULE transposase domain-containing protein n=1 Tax=Panagrolaimus sp. JU765 TaxID=591449 RepID=A0AC34PX93_9BILA